MKYLFLIMALTGCSSTERVITTQRAITLEKISCDGDECSFRVELVKTGELQVWKSHVRTHIPQVLWRTCVNNECSEKGNW